MEKDSKKKRNQEVEMTSPLVITINPRILIIRYKIQAKVISWNY